MSSKCVSSPVLRALLLLWALGLTAPASATVLGNQALEGLATDAPLIVTATCVESRSYWLGRMLVTETQVQVDETLKGTPPVPLRVVVPGGSDVSRTPAIAMVVPGAPQLPAGSRVLLYLRPLPQPAGTFTPLGLASGVVTIPPGGSGWLTSLLAEIRQQVALATPTPATPPGIERR